MRDRIQYDLRIYIYGLLLSLLVGVVVSLIGSLPAKDALALKHIE